MKAYWDGQNYKLVFDLEGHEIKGNFNKSINELDIIITNGIFVNTVISTPCFGNEFDKIKIINCISKNNQEFKPGAEDCPQCDKYRVNLLQKCPCCGKDIRTA